MQEVEADKSPCVVGPTFLPTGFYSLMCPYGLSSLQLQARPSFLTLSTSKLLIVLRTLRPSEKVVRAPKATQSSVFQAQCSSIRAGRGEGHPELPRGSMEIRGLEPDLECLSSGSTMEEFKVSKGR